jgi:hypothetical protein
MKMTVFMVESLELDKLKVCSKALVKRVFGDLRDKSQRAIYLLYISKSGLLFTLTSSCPCRCRKSMFNVSYLRCFRTLIVTYLKYQGRVMRRVAA